MGGKKAAAKGRKISQIGLARRGTIPELHGRRRRDVLTSGITTGTPTALRSVESTDRHAQKVVIVNGSPDVLELLETVLEAGRYDIVFVESNAHAYSQIKRVQPNLVILCVRIEDMDGFQVLSMLKIDEETRDIPILTYTTEFEGQDVEPEAPEPSDTEMFAAAPVLRMN
jgi:CheY-like chemotaxis protein